MWKQATSQADARGEERVAAGPKRNVTGRMIADRLRSQLRKFHIDWEA